MKNKILPIFFIIFFVITFFIFYKGLKISTIYTPKIYLDKKIPIFKAKIFESDKMTSSEEMFISEQFYLMNIWSSWCVPCRKEHPFLINLSRNENIEIIGLNYKDSVNNAKKFLDELMSPYGIIISDPEGTIAIEWGAYGVPESFLVYKKKL